MTQQLEFRRIVLGLPYNRPGHGMRLATELAHLLQLDLFGLFVEEESLRGLAALPFAREFRPLGGGWQPINMEQLSRDFEIAGKSAEKIFTEAAKTLRTTCKFEVVRGSMAETIASISRAGDIVLITEPERAADQVSPQYLSSLNAALRSAAAVLLVPGRIARHSGAIVAVANEPGDPSIDVAKAIALASREELVVLETNEPGIGAALRNVAERLIVISRPHGSSPSAIASLRRVPILIVDRTRGKFEIDQSSSPEVEDFEAKQ